MLVAIYAIWHRLLPKGFTGPILPSISQLGCEKHDASAEVATADSVHESRDSDPKLTRVVSRRAEPGTVHGSLPRRPYATVGLMAVLPVVA